jgi:hypothetical protein
MSNDPPHDGVEDGTRFAYHGTRSVWHVEIDIEEADGPVGVFVSKVFRDGALVGEIKVAAEVTVGGDDELHLKGAHIQGLDKGALGREGMNAIGEAMREAMDVAGITVEGEVRTTGANPGRRPRAFRYPNDGRAARRGPRP